MTDQPPEASGLDLEAENARLRRLLEAQATSAAFRHQIRDTLGMIRSIVRRSAAFNATATSYASHLEGRIEAILRVQGAITREAAEGIDMHGVVADELLAHATREGDQVHIVGPAIRLRPRIAEFFALAIHELTINAIKFGALGQGGGRLAVNWDLSAIARQGGDRQLNFAWAESVASPGPASCGRRGFGTDVLEETLRFELKAETTLQFRPEGLRCTIRLPFTPQTGTGPAAPPGHNAPAGTA